MAQVIRVYASVPISAVAEAVKDFNVQMFYGEEGLGTRVIGHPDEEVELKLHLSNCFPGNVDVILTDNHVPEDWAARGFVHETVSALNEEPTLVASSGLGLHTT